MENQVRAIIIRVPLMVLLAGCATPPAPSAADIPTSLRVSATDLSTRRTHATGVQVYQCRGTKDDAARFEWQLKEPAADLFDKTGRKIGRHYAGPTWEADDGSKVIGEVVAHVNSPDSNGVAWLLLSAKSTSGNGIFQDVRFIQRLHTAGGNAPADGCRQASAGSEVRVPYSADYWFYSAKR
jgi:hypothetical protein